MIKVYCDICNREIVLKDEDCTCFNIEVNYNKGTYEIADDGFPTQFNKSMCSDCEEALFIKFSTDWCREGYNFINMEEY